MDSNLSDDVKEPSKIFQNENAPSGKCIQSFFFNKDGQIGYAIGKQHRRIEVLKKIADTRKISILKPDSTKHWGGFYISAPTPEKCDLAMRMLAGWVCDYDFVQYEDGEMLDEYYTARECRNLPNGHPRQTMFFNDCCLAGKIIGKEYARVEKIKERYNVKIRTFRANYNAGSTRGGMIIEGSPEDCDLAVRHFRTKMWRQCMQMEAEWAEWDSSAYW